ncbi:MAG TPA: hypothetical protein VNW92_24315, partial [Polyangiaceae bacterium]|nr:hypothetical protein [Polyangiaceae bacterium]
MASSRGTPSRFGKYLRRALYAVGGLLGLVVLLVLGLLVSLRFARVRSYVVVRVNSALADSFKGKITLHGLGGIGLFGIAGADAEVFDPAGRRVLDVHGLDVNLSVPTVAWAALTHKSKPLTLRFSSVKLRHCEAALLDDGAGSPTLADAFAPKTPSPPSSGPGTIIELEHIELEHIWAHGALAGTPPLDVELKHALGSLRSTPTETAIAFQRAQIQARGLPQAVDPSGALEGSLNIPAAPDQPIAARAHYRGSAAGIPVAFDASYVAAKIEANLQVPSIPPGALEQQVP